MKSSLDGLEAKGLKNGKRNFHPSLPSIPEQAVLEQPQPSLLDIDVNQKAEINPSFPKDRITITGLVPEIHSGQNIIEKLGEDAQGVNSRENPAAELIAKLSRVMGEKKIDTDQVIPRGEADNQQIRTLGSTTETYTMPLQSINSVAVAPQTEPSVRPATNPFAAAFSRAQVAPTATAAVVAYVCAKLGSQHSEHTTTTKKTTKTTTTTEETTRTTTGSSPKRHLRSRL